MWDGSADCSLVHPQDKRAAIRQVQSSPDPGVAMDFLYLVVKPHSGQSPASQRRGTILNVCPNSAQA